MSSTRVFRAYIIAASLAAAALLSPKAALADVTVERQEETTPVALPGGKAGFTVTAGTPLVLTISGPGTVEAQAMRALGPKKPRRKVGSATLTVSVDGATAMKAAVPAKAGPGSAKSRLGRARSFAFHVEGGTHEVSFAVGAGDKLGVVLVFAHPLEVAAARAPLAAAIPSAAAIPAPPVAEPSPEPAPLTNAGAADSSAEHPPLVPLAPAPDAGVSSGVGTVEVIAAAPATELAHDGTGAVAALGGDSSGDYPVRLGVRLGGYHPSGGSDLGAAIAAGIEARVGVPLLPSSLGRLSAGISASWLTFTSEKTLSDPALGSFDTRYTMRVMPATLEAVYEPPALGPVQLYGGAGLAVYTALSESEAFAYSDERVSVRPGLQAFGAVGLPLGPVLLGLELRYTNVSIDFDTGTVGSGAGLFGQAVASVRVF